MIGSRLDLADALAGAADGAFVIDPEGRIVTWNRAAGQILGYRASEAVGRRCCEILAGRDLEGARACWPDCHVRTLARDGKTAGSFDVRTVTKAGRPVWINLSTLRARSAGRTFVVHLFRDVTETWTLLKPSKPDPPTTPEESLVTLTRRERQVVTLLASGGNTREMAARLQVSRATIRNHVQSILGKLGVHSRLEAVALVSGHAQRGSSSRSS